MSEQYFLVRKFGLGKEVVSLSLVVTEVSRRDANLFVVNFLEITNVGVAVSEKLHLGHR